MTHVVAKPFSTINRRFRAGDAVSETDDIEPHNFADMKLRGFIVAKVSEKPKASFFKKPEQD